MQRYATIEKKVGETPLEAAHRLRADLGLSESVPLSYAGRLDPMASGKLLILIGDECKRQKHYHGLDKEYQFSVLFGVSSDTGDVLGLIKSCGTPEKVTKEKLKAIAKELEGKVSLPFPHFSSKTIKGKPLHTWTLEGRLDEIDIPVQKSVVYKLALNTLETGTGKEIADEAQKKIALPTKVTETSKALGRDFRRDEVNALWNSYREENGSKEYAVATFTCIASSGTYMRSLAEEIGKKLGTCSLAYSIHRTVIGKYLSIKPFPSLWIKRY